MRISETTRKLCEITDYIGGVALLFMMSLTVLDVILRYLGVPILGSYELASLSGGAVVGFALPRTSLENTHVTVDVLVDRQEEGRKNVLLVITRIMALALFVVFSYNLVDVGRTLYRTNESTLTLCCPLYPFAYLLAVCCMIECFVLCVQIVELARGGEKNE